MNSLSKEIKKVLFQNILAPLALGFLSSFVIAILIYEVKDANKWVEHTDEVIHTLTTIQKLISDSQAGARGYLMSKPKNKAFLDLLNSAQQGIPKLVDELEALVKEDQLQSSRVEELTPLLDDWFLYTTDILSLSEKDYEKALAQFTSTDGEKKTTEIRSKIKDLLEEETRLRTVRIKTKDDFIFFITAFFIPFMIIGTALLAFFGRKSIFNISENYETQLQKNIDQFVILEHDKWLRDNESKLFDELLKTSSLEELGSSMITYFSQHFGFLAGTLSIINDTLENNFSRITSVGVDSSKLPTQEFNFKKSLVANVFDTHKPKVYTNFDSSNWSLEHSLGVHRPQFLLAAPITYLGKNFAILEMVINEKPPDAFVEFLEVISEKLGVMIANEITKIRLANLNEDIRQKSEELRASNVELEERAELLRNSQNQLEAKNDQLSQFNERLESQTRILEEQKERLDQRNQDLVKTKNEIEKKSQELIEVSNYKSQFLANMSHELRTPLNSSMILAQLLIENKTNNLSAKQVEYAKQIYASGQSLLALINDVLDISKVESGTIDLEPTIVSIDELINRLESTFSLMAEKKNLKLKFINECTPSEIITDPLRLEQIANNLLSNALKFTEQGSVVAHFKIFNRLDKASLFQMTVTDTGAGIAKTLQEIIFEPFRQADEMTSRKYGGTGLGLSIAQKLAGLLGGEIKVESAVGVGSTFTLAIATSLIKEEKVPIKSFVDQTQLKNPTREKKTEVIQKKSIADESKVLIVEDDEIFANIMEDHLMEQGYLCIRCSTAEECLIKAEEENPTAIILDINLPDFSGLTVLESLKYNLNTRSIPVHVTSVEDKASLVHRLGATSFFLKSMFIERIRDFIGFIAVAKNQSDSKQVLLIEDDINQSEAISELIQTKKVKVHIVNSGVEALNKLKSENKFDCIILDMKLPDISGFEFLRRLRSMKLLHAHPPIVVYTDYSLTPSEEAEIKTLAQSIIIKNANSSERLLDEVSLFLRQSLESMDEKNKKILMTISSRKNSLEGYRILLVDDDVRNIFSLTAVLENKKAKVQMANNGQEAIDILSQDSCFDIVLMDIMMPVMDGYEAIKQIRQTLKLESLPVIALTAKAMKNDRHQCLLAGANDYMAKPLESEKLASLIRIWSNKIM